MQREYSWLQKLRFYTTVSMVYLLTVGFFMISVQPQRWFDPKPVALTRAQQKPPVLAPDPAIIAGKPVRIVVPGSSIDLPIDEGYYDASNNSWTLSGYRAQFAMISSPANNKSGDTFIYGHNNNDVFGALRHNAPMPGAEALIYTDNGHIFAYKFQASTSLKPDDTSVLSYKGPAMLTIQTCTGSVDEWRTMFRFSFEKVVS